MDDRRFKTFYFVLNLFLSIQLICHLDCQGTNRNLQKTEQLLTYSDQNQLSEKNQERYFVKRDLHHKDPCALYGTCSYNKNLMFPNCKCDDNCPIYQDCCFDAVKNITTDTTRFHSNMVKYMTCLIQQDASRVFSGFNWGHQMVLKCPQDFANSTIKELCELSREKFVPVTSTRTNLTYINVFCAFCHNEEVYIPWTMRFSGGRCGIKNQKQIQLVNDNSNLKIFKEMLLTFCQPTFEPSSGLLMLPRVCTDIPKNSSHGDHRCNAYVNPVFRTECSRLHCLTAYNNYFCLGDENVIFHCKDPMAKTHSFRFKPLTIVFRFGIQTRKDYENDCENRALDLKTGLCISDTDNQTQPKDEKVTLKNTIVMASYGLTVTNNTDEQTFERFIWSFCLRCLRLSKTLLRETYVRIDDLCEPKKEGGYTYCSVKFHISITIVEEISAKLFYLFQHAVKNIVWLYKETADDSLDDVMIYYKNSSNYDNISRDNYITILRMVNMMKYESYLLDRDLYIVENETLVEKVKELPETCNISATVNKHGKIVNLTVKLFSDQDILRKPLKDESVSIYKDRSKGNNSQIQMNGQVPLIKKDSSIEIIVTYLTMGLSIISLVFTLFFMKCINIEQNTSCYMATNVISVLLTAHLLFVFGSGMIDYPTLCFIVGFLSLYTWLSFFIWINIFVLYITLKIKSVWEFLGPKNCGSSMVEDRFGKANFIVGYCLPFVVVIPSIFIDFYHVRNIKIINTEHECFPNTFPSNLVVFVGPVLLSVFFNLICLCVSALHIYRLRHVKLHSSIHTTKSYITMFVKLCSISGVSWLVGVFAELYQVRVLNYIFITFSGLHGFLFSLCFLSSKQVKDALRKKFQKKHDKVQVDYLDEFESDAPKHDRDITGSSNIDGKSHETLSNSTSIHLSVISDQIIIHSDNTSSDITEITSSVSQGAVQVCETQITTLQNYDATECHYEYTGLKQNQENDTKDIRIDSLKNSNVDKNSYIDCEHDIELKQIEKNDIKDVKINSVKNSNVEKDNRCIGCKMSKLKGKFYKESENKNGSIDLDNGTDVMDCETDLISVIGTYTEAEPRVVKTNKTSDIFIRQTLVSKINCGKDTKETKGILKSVVSNKVNTIVHEDICVYQECAEVTNESAMCTEEYSNRHKHAVSKREIIDDENNEIFQNRTLNKRLDQSMNRTEIQEIDISTSVLKPGTEYQKTCMFNPELDDQDAPSNSKDNKTSQGDLVHVIKKKQVVQHEVYLQELGQF